MVLSHLVVLVVFVEPTITEVTMVRGTCATPDDRNEGVYVSDTQLHQRWSITRSGHYLASGALDNRAKFLPRSGLDTSKLADLAMAPLRAFEVDWREWCFHTCS